MKGNIKMINKMDLDCLRGMMENNIGAIGKMGNRTEKENSFFLMKTFGEKEFGKKEKERNGLIK